MEGDMSSKASMESRIVTWFATAEVGTAEVVLGIVKGIVKQRRTVTVAQVTTPPKRTRKRKARLNGNDAPIGDMPMHAVVEQ